MLSNDLSIANVDSDSRYLSTLAFKQLYVYNDIHIVVV